MFKNIFLPPTITGEVYIPRKKLGEGDYNAVYIGYTLNDNNQRHPYSLKLPITFNTSQEKITAIKREVYYLNELKSPHTAQYVDHSEDPIIPYIVKELIPETLQEKIENNSIQQNVIIHYLQQIPIILAFLRHKEKIHADLKCSNLGYAQRIKLLDLGSVISPRSRQKLICPHGYSPWHPPELKRSQTLNLSSDTYMAGKNIEYLLTGNFLNSAEEALDTIELYHNTQLPETFKKIITAMTHKTPEERITPSALIPLAQEAIKDLNKKVYFSPQSFVSISIPLHLLEIN